MAVAMNITIFWHVTLCFLLPWRWMSWYIILLNCFSLTKQGPQTAPLYHSSQHKRHLSLCIPCMFKHSTRMFTSSYMDIIPIYLIAKMKLCFVAGRDFWQKYFIFCSKVYNFYANLKPITVIWCHALKCVQSLRLARKALSKNFLHTWLWYIEILGSPCAFEFLAFHR
jgi:hypothetical protein